MAGHAYPREARPQVADAHDVVDAGHIRIGSVRHEARPRAGQGRRREGPVADKVHEADAASHLSRLVPRERHAGARHVRLGPARRQRRRRDRPVAPPQQPVDEAVDIAPLAAGRDEPVRVPQRVEQQRHVPQRRAGVAHAVLRVVLAEGPRGVPRRAEHRVAIFVHLLEEVRQREGRPRLEPTVALEEERVRRLELGPEGRVPQALVVRLLGVVLAFFYGDVPQAAHVRPRRERRRVLREGDDRDVGIQGLARVAHGPVQQVRPRVDDDRRHRRRCSAAHQQRGRRSPNDEVPRTHCSSGAASAQMTCLRFHSSYRFVNPSPESVASGNQNYWHEKPVCKTRTL